ncbi:MAG TPA: HD domain-containing phosphohydrolase [Candidatus Hydrogenedentes bacterium]|nr:HD domain-containing phosphohydrolase [Candidatus Hydrogenedentota bacterium]
MLNRVVMVGGEKGAQESLADEAVALGLSVASLDSGATPPSGTACVIAETKNAKAALSACVNVAKHHNELLFLLGEAIDSREDLQPGSSMRVMDCASRFGKSLHLSPEDQNTLERGALLRDIGKLRIPNSLLLKYTILTHDEWEAIRGHTHRGGDLVSVTAGLQDIENIVRFHHECWDGTGYPNGLERDEIPRLAQIVRLVDVFCAMTAPRHYRKNVHSTKDALDHLKSEAGKHFNGELVEAFLDAKIGK